ncbi:MAG: hypothetical protein HYY33_06305, partial [Chloroflexi bacterium]|nr:hypothetical protein [Chloroflexota bacterium]
MDILRQSTEAYLWWLTLALGLGLALSLLAGLYDLSRARSLPYFLLRRQALERGWRSILIAVFFLLFGIAVALGGKPLVELVITPTVTPTISPTPSLTPTLTRTPTITPVPSAT